MENTELDPSKLYADKLLQHKIEEKSTSDKKREKNSNEKKGTEIERNIGENVWQ